jgi:hypothetical protein
MNVTVCGELIFEKNGIKILESSNDNVDFLDIRTMIEENYIDFDDFKQNVIYKYKLTYHITHQCYYEPTEFESIIEYIKLKMEE